MSTIQIRKAISEFVIYIRDLCFIFLQILIKVKKIGTIKKKHIWFHKIFSSLFYTLYLKIKLLLQNYEIHVTDCNATGSFP